MKKYVCDLCGYEYDPEVGVIYNGKVVFHNNEFQDFDREEITFEEMYSDISEREEEIEEKTEMYKFYEKNQKTMHYYFFCARETDSWKKEDFDYIDDEKNRVLVKPNGFMLYKGGKDLRVGYTGAHVHLHIPIDYNIKSANK